MMYLAAIFYGVAADRRHPKGARREANGTCMAAWTRVAGRLPRGREAKFDGDVFLSCHRLSAEQSGFISPLADGVDCGRDEGRGAGESLDTSDFTIRADGGAQGYIAFDTGRARDRWIARGDVIDERAEPRLR